jgi:catechol 2,3-dioxygenase-like lactoylglutathione lyase family enzyme
MKVARANAITGIDCVSYLVKDTDRALKFWRDTVGLEPTREYPEGSGAEFTFDDGTTFELYKTQDGTWNPGSGVMFRVADVKAAVADLKQRGVEFEDNGELHDDDHCTMAFAKDSEGNSFILHHLKE